MRIWFGPSRMMPMPTPFSLEDLSTYKVHRSPSGACCRSLTKSNRHYALMGPCGSWHILNSDNLTDYDDTLLAKSGF